ncbi:MAG: prolyl oligopeptidase family serine peptidase, partial [candidate division Zixibacteria bacterium]|nr:prolyl oligopeptidase family serine peptidase [candidate division Zixibacteria bacterium]
DGTNPTLLYGYGGFDISITPNFIRGLYVWLDRGGVYAVANIRGGGEYGRTWHEAGRLEKKQNVYDDFIYAGEWLIANKYTSSQKLAIQGGSNGGLLMGAMLTQRPDLFKAVVCQVPLLDMLRYDKFLIARLWIPEYGSASDPKQFQWLYAYSPYQKVKEGIKYPATLITTGVQDSRVDPMHAFKMAALLQKANASANPILLRVEPKAGHGAGKPVSKILNEQTDIWSFLLWQLGVNNKLASSE